MKEYYYIFLELTILVFLIAILVIQITNSNLQYSHKVYALGNTKLNDFNLAAAGDWGCTSATNSTVKNIINKKPELVLGLGDYGYRNDATCWLKIVKPVENKMRLVIGNHDDKAYMNEKYLPAPKRLEQYMNHFNLSKEFYSFDYQNVHFLAMSTEDPYMKGSVQYRFAENDLKKAASNNSTDWIVVFYHRDAYTSPGMVGAIIDFRNIYHPLFDKYGVDIVLQGHNHNYQRSYPIRYHVGNGSEPIITDNATSNYIKPKGAIFTIVGTGGVNVIHNFTGAPAKFTANQFHGYGFLNLDFVHNGSKLIAEFHDNDGTIKDRFSITKQKKIGNQVNSTSSETHPTLTSKYLGKFKIESVFKGLKSPTDMAFLNTANPRDIIVLEKNKGTVQRINNSSMFERPLLDVNVSNKNERGLLGMVIPEHKTSTPKVYLYYTEANATNESCPKPDYCLRGIEPIGNRVYEYDLSQDGTSLKNPNLILDLPAVPGPSHNGGKMKIGPDNYIYLAIGDLMGHMTKAENYEDGSEPDGTGGILRFDFDGNPKGDHYLGNKYPSSLYYAYGIRNSFGIDFDSVTGNLWDTENGPDFADEINLVMPGSNSGWKDVQGIWQQKGGKPQNITLTPPNLADFNGKSTYSAPEFIFFNTVGVTAIKFFDSNKMGSQFENDLFVGDFKNGRIYHFDLNKNRTGLILDGVLSDKIANTDEELEMVTFAQGFSGISDLEVGPDGYLYVLDYGKGTIYRIIPR